VAGQEKAFGYSRLMAEEWQMASRTTCISRVGPSSRVEFETKPGRMHVEQSSGDAMRQALIAAACVALGALLYALLDRFVF